MNWQQPFTEQKLAYALSLRTEFIQASSFEHFIPGYAKATGHSEETWFSPSSKYVESFLFV